MRIARLELSNFRCYLDASIDLGRVTLLTGPNDGGKSTLIDALRSLFVDTDRMGHVMSWDRVRHRPMGEQAINLTELVEGSGARGRPSFVLSTIAVDGADGWAVLGDAVKLGSYWIPGAPSPHRCMVMSDGDFRATLGDPADWQDWLNAVEIARDANGIWLDFAELREALHEPLKSDLWPPLDADTFVHVPGPDAPPASPADVLRPLIARRVEAEIPSDDGSTAALWRGTIPDLVRIESAVDRAVERVEDAYAQTVSDYVPSIYTPRLRRRGVLPTFRELANQILGDLDVSGVRADGVRSVGEMGAGTRRAATMAAVELYTRQDLVYSESDIAYVVLEEPEVGLHPSAQRRVARALARAAEYAPHVQFLVVTHAAAFIETAAPEWLRVCQPSTKQPGTCEVSEVAGLGAAADSLGITASDALLASHVLVVEGRSDAAILSVWSDTNGESLSTARVAVIDAGGHGPVEQITRVLTLVYGSIGVTVVLDNGSDTHRTKLVLEERFGDRVDVILLPETEIEGMFTDRAVVEWATRRGAESSAVSSILESDPRKSKKRLRRLSHELFGQPYDVVGDGAAIAGLMREAEIPPVVRGLLTQVVAGRS